MKANTKSGAGVVGRALGGLARAIWRRPGRALAWTGGLGAFAAIAVNALVLQTDRHPAPFFARSGAVEPALSRPASPISPEPARASVAAPQTARPLAAANPATASAPPQPAPRPGGLAPARPDSTATLSQPAARAPAPNAERRATPEPERRPADLRAEPVRDSIAMLIRGELPPRPPALVPDADAPERERVAAIQRALVKLGHSVTIDGIAGPQTRRAIEEFERANNLPVTGQPATQTVRAISRRAAIEIP